MAHSLGLSTVGEGVESAHQHHWLRSRGCDEIQGYLLGKPQPFENVLELLQSGAQRKADPESARVN